MPVRLPHRNASCLQLAVGKYDDVIFSSRTLASKIDVRYITRIKVKYRHYHVHMWIKFSKYIIHIDLRIVSDTQ